KTEHASALYPRTTGVTTPAPIGRKTWLAVPDAACHKLTLTGRARVPANGPSELVRSPRAHEVDVIGARGFEESFGEEVYVGGVHGYVRGRLPFGLKIGLCAEIALVVRGAGHERNPRRLVERIVCAVAPEHVDASLDGEVRQRLNRHRRIGIDEVDR